MRLTDPRIAIVGSGAVGCFYGGRLLNSGLDVHFLMRSDLEHAAKEGLRIESKHYGDLFFPHPNVYGDTAKMGSFDLVIIALKATDNDSFGELIMPLIREDTALLTLQNGLGNEDCIAGLFGAHRVMGGLCFVCLNRIGPGLIRHVAEGSVSIGEYTGQAVERTRDVGLLFRRAGIPCNVSQCLMTERWRKLVWNIPFNGLSIVSGSSDTGAILADSNLRSRACELMREVIRIARLCGYQLPMSMVDEQIALTEGMGAYRPSSVIDYAKGKRVEVEAIWGNALRAGMKAGAEVALLEELYREILESVGSREYESG
ncbi:MAG: 2-dehydropantoate 2-reductase [Verrucomicrobiota bacterium]|nr:2-dehydropantoate 2-reductase [Verrucomicrobiota bacterium]